MIKKTSLFIALILLTSLTFVSENTDRKTVEQSTLNWADSIFYEHDNYRFEQFHAEYTDSYQIANLRLKMYQGKQENLEKTKQKGFYKKTDIEYKKELSELIKKNIDLKQIIDTFEDKAKFYQILFWSNIKTNQGPTVYYSHLIKLDQYFQC